MAVADQHRHPAADAAGRFVSPTGASTVTAANGLLPMVQTAPSGRCEYFSTTHGNWIQAKIVASDMKTGAIQIDKKPGVWISPDEQKVRIRVTKASAERAAKDAKSVGPARAGADAGAMSETSIRFPAPVPVNGDHAVADGRGIEAGIPLDAARLNGDSSSNNGLRRGLGSRVRGSTSGSGYDAEFRPSSPCLVACEIGGSTASNSSPQVRQSFDASAHDNHAASTRSGVVQGISEGRLPDPRHACAAYPAQDRQTLSSMAIGLENPTHNFTQHLANSRSLQNVSAGHISAAHPVRGMAPLTPRATTLLPRGQNVREDPLFAQQADSVSASSAARSLSRRGQLVNEDPSVRCVSSAHPVPLAGSEAAKTASSLGKQAVSDDLLAAHEQTLTYPEKCVSSGVQKVNRELLLARQHTSEAYPEPIGSSAPRPANPVQKEPVISEELQHEGSSCKMPRFSPQGVVQQAGAATSAAQAADALLSFTRQQSGDSVVSDATLAAPPRPSTANSLPNAPIYPSSDMPSSFARQQQSRESGASDITLPAPRHVSAAEQLPDPPFRQPVSDIPSSFARQLSSDHAGVQDALQNPPIQPMPGSSASITSFARQLSSEHVGVQEALQNPPIQPMPGSSSPLPLFARQLSSEQVGVHEALQHPPIQPMPGSSSSLSKQQASSSFIQQSSGACSAARTLSGASALNDEQQECFEPQGMDSLDGREPVEQSAGQALSENPLPKRHPCQAVDESGNKIAASSAASVSASATPAAAVLPSPGNGMTKSSSALPLEDTIALDEYGRPLIVRQIHPENGSARTLVMNDDGSQKVFGEHTVASLTNSNEEEAKKWVLSLNGTQLRGLVHEVGQRLLEGSRLYHARLSQLEKLGEHLNYVYFGLTADSSDKELDQAYRSLAKRMHPDKNGGTEEAKRRFQQMKERYELLKKRRGAVLPEDDEDDEVAAPDYSGGEEEPDEDGARCLKDRKPPRSKTAEEEEEVEAQEQARVGDKADGENSSNIQYDPKDRESMLKTVTKMLGQLKNVEVQMKVVVKELKRIQSEVATVGTMPCI